MQLVRLFRTVKIYELQTVQLTQLVHDLPVVVLGNKYLVQVYVK